VSEGRAEKKQVPKAQPRDVNIHELRQPETYRAGLQAELLQFGKKERDIQQLGLFEKGGALDKAETEPFGLDFSVPEAKAVHAIQILLSKTGYRGDKAATEHTKAYGTVLLPTIELTYSDFFEAYGLSRTGGRFQGKAPRDALEALRSLQTARPIGYERTRWTGEGRKRRQVSDIVRTRIPLISIMEVFEGLEESEASRVKAGESMEHRVSRLAIKVGPVLLDGIQDFFLVKPQAFFKEIAQLYGGRSGPRAVSLFCQWLLTKDRTPQKVGKDTLATLLRLDGYVRQRKKTALEKKLSECLDVAKSLGYLTAFEDTGTMLVLHLSPERCSRLKKRKHEKAGR